MRFSFLSRDLANPQWPEQATVALDHQQSLKPLVIKNATVIDGSGGPPITNGVIIVVAERISAVGSTELAIPSDASILDAGGKFVIPGLMDASVHLVLDYFPATLVKYEGRYDSLAIEAAQVALRNGVTTVFDTWGPKRYLVAAREAVNSGQAQGSRIYIAGNIIGLNGPLSEDFFPQGRSALFEELSDRINLIWQENVGRELMEMSPDEVSDRVEKYTASGIDFLRYAASGHGPAAARYIQFSPRVQRAIVEAAHRAGLTVQSHTSSVEAVGLAMDAGVDILQQTSTTGIQSLPPETIAALVDKRVACGILANTEKAMSWYRTRFGLTNPSGRAYLAREAADRSERALLRAGANILMSTDSGLVSMNTERSNFWVGFAPPSEYNCPFLLGEAHFHWLRAVEEKSMGPMQALMAATRNVAQAYKVDGDLGTLEPGKLADLVILDRDPLIASENYRSISAVIKNGCIVDRSRLPEHRWLTAPISPSSVPAESTIGAYPRAR